MEQEETKLDFSHLPYEEGAIFPYCCSNGYFLLWNTELRQPKIEPPKTEAKQKAETLLWNELARLKQSLA